MHSLGFMMIDTCVWGNDVSRRQNVIARRRGLGGTAVWGHDRVKSLGHRRTGNPPATTPTAAGVRVALVTGEL